MKPSFQVFNYGPQYVLDIVYPTSNYISIPTLSSDPSVTSAGFVYYNTNSSSLKLSTDIDTWVELSSGSLNAALQSIANLTTTGDEMIYTITSNTYATSPLAPAGRSFLSATTPTIQRSILGLAIGQDVQQYSSILTSLESIAFTPDKLPYTSSGSYASTSLSSWSRTNLLNLSSISDLNTLLGTVIASTITTSNLVPKISGTNTITQSGISIDNLNNISGINDINIGGNLVITGTLAGITQSEISQIQNINSTTISNNQWGYLGSLDQSLSTSSTPSFTGMNLSGILNMNANKITMSYTALANTDVTNKQYVDNLVGTGLSSLQSCNVATTTALPSSVYSSSTGTITASSGNTLTIDGVSIIANDTQRILVKNQASVYQNGVYTRISDSSGNWVLSRTSDFNTPPLLKNLYTLIINGTDNKNSSWILAQTVTQFDPIVSGSDVIWNQFSASSNFTFDNGLIQTGNSVNVDPTGKFVFTTGQLDLNTIQPSYGGTGRVLTSGDTNQVMITNGTSSVNISKSAPSSDFVGISDSQIITNKTLTSSTNNITASSLFSNSGSNTINISSASNPTAGQILTAVNSSSASWSTPSFAEFNPSNIFFVSKNANDVSPNFTTLAGAISAVNAQGATVLSPCLIYMYPGTYTENNPLIIPANCSVTAGTSNQNTVVIKPSNTGNVLLSLEGSCRLNGLVIDGNGLSTIGINSVYTGSYIGVKTDLVNNTTVKNCTLSNFSVSGISTYLSEASVNTKILICKNVSSQTLIPSLVTTNGFACFQGAILSGLDFTASTFLSSGSSGMTYGFNCYDQNSYMDISRVQVTSCSTGIKIGDGSVPSNSQVNYPNLRLINGLFSFYTAYGIYADAKSSSRLINCQFEINTVSDYANQISMFVVNPSLPAENNFVETLSCNIRQDKISIFNGATNNQTLLIGINLSEIPGLIHNQVYNDMSIGVPNYASELHCGEGTPYIYGMTVFVYNALTNTSTDQTNNASFSTNTFQVFPTIQTVNNALYVACTNIFYGIDVYLTTAIQISSGLIGSAVIFEFWNGSAWTNFNINSTLIIDPYTNKSNTPLAYGDVLATTTGYQYRFGKMTNWSTTLKTGASIVLPVGVSDVLRYYMRIRVANTLISVVPVIDTINIEGNSVKLSNTGLIQYYGNGRVLNRQPIDMNILSSTGTAGETAATSTRFIATNTPTTIAVNRANSTFADAVLTTVVYIWNPPYNIDTSLGINFNILFSRNVAAAGNIILKIDYVFVTPPNVIANPTGSPDAVGKTSGNIVVAVPTNNRESKNVTIPLSIQDLDPNVSSVWFKIARLGADASDTYANTIYILNMSIDYYVMNNGMYGF
jgi:hypothetical protein